jgi:hypothetical protein
MATTLAAWSGSINFRAGEDYVDGGSNSVVQIAGSSC